MADALWHSVRLLQRRADELYGRLEAERAMLWFVEEVGELARAVRKHDLDNISEELGQVFVWTLCLANILSVPLDAAALAAWEDEHARQLAKYGHIRPYGLGGDA